jgi:hypothetical protein
MPILRAGLIVFIAVHIEIGLNNDPGASGQRGPSDVFRPHDTTKVPSSTRRKTIGG